MSNIDEYFRKGLLIEPLSGMCAHSLEHIFGLMFAKFSWDMREMPAAR